MELSATRVTLDQHLKFGVLSSIDYKGLRIYSEALFLCVQRAICLSIYIADAV